MLDKFDIQLCLMGLKKPRYSEDEFRRTAIPCPYCDKGAGMMYYGYGNWQCKSCGKSAASKMLRTKINDDLKAIESKE